MITQRGTSHGRTPQLSRSLARWLDIRSSRVSFDACSLCGRWSFAGRTCLSSAAGPPASRRAAAAVFVYFPLTGRASRGGGTGGPARCRGASPGHVSNFFVNFKVARWCNGKAFGLAISRSRVQILLEATLRNNLRQVVYTYVPLSASSITWYRALRVEYCIVGIPHNTTI